MDPVVQPIIDLRPAFPEHSGAPQTQASFSHPTRSGAKKKAAIATVVSLLVSALIFPLFVKFYEDRVDATKKRQLTDDWTNMVGPTISEADLDQLAYQYLTSKESTQRSSIRFLSDTYFQARWATPIPQTLREYELKSAAYLEDLKRRHPRMADLASRFLPTGTKIERVGHGHALSAVHLPAERVDEWERLVASDPYALTPDTDDTRNTRNRLRKECGSNRPIVRFDWVVSRLQLNPEAKDDLEILDFASEYQNEFLDLDRLMIEVGASDRDGFRRLVEQTKDAQAFGFAPLLSGGRIPRHQLEKPLSLISPFQHFSLRVNPTIRAVPPETE